MSAWPSRVCNDRKSAPRLSICVAKLSHLSPSDHAAIADALAVAGLPNTAVALRQEALSAHLMMALLAAMGDEAS